MEMLAVEETRGGGRGEGEGGGVGRVGARREGETT
jgi:hypothetical protein